MGYQGRRREWFLVANVTCIRETDKALLVRVPALKEGNPPTEDWVPKSQLHDEENEITTVGDVGMLVCSEWIAKEKGWYR